MKFAYSTILSLFALANVALAHGGDHSDDEAAGSGGDYVVLVEQDDPRTVEQVIIDLGATNDEIEYIYNNTAFKGFAGRMSKHCVEQLGIMSGIKKYEQKIQFRVAEVQTQTDASWGLSRISQQGAVGADQDPLALNFQYTFENEPAGAGVDVYVVDTGVNTEHVDFGGRASFGFAFDGLNEDENGHGTHCAGTVASGTLGVAKAANIIAVKVLGADGSGDNASILAGINFVIENHNARKGDAAFAGSIISMSLGSEVVSEVLDDAVTLASAEGIHVSVAAGNSGVDACNSSPALASLNSAVISVGAIDIGDNRADFSNFGSCVTTYGPGVDVLSTFIDPQDPINGENNIINNLSGTSMACPHVSGLIAYYLGLRTEFINDVAGMKDFIVQNSEVIQGLQGVAGDPGIVATNLGVPLA